MALTYILLIPFVRFSDMNQLGMFENFTLTRVILSDYSGRQFSILYSVCEFDLGLNSNSKSVS